MYPSVALPRITIPSKVYAVVGTELNLFYDTLILGNDRGITSPEDYDVEVVCSVGVQKERCYKILPVAGNIGTKSLTVNVYNYNHELLKTKTISLIIASSTAMSAVKNVLQVGDSLTYAGTITQTVQSSFADLTNNIPVFYGTQGSNPAKNEGRAGWTIAQFVGASSPFYNGGVLDIANYRSTLGMGTTKFDLVTIQLGINDCFTNTLLDSTNILAKVANMTRILEAFLADNANTKIIVNLPSTDGNTKGGWGTNYGAASSKAVYQANIWNLREQLILAYDLDAYSANVQIGIAGLVCDRYYGYELSSVAVSSRVSTTELVHVNAVHPTTSGYEQMGDAAYCQISNLLR